MSNGTEIIPDSQYILGRKPQEPTIFIRLATNLAFSNDQYQPPFEPSQIGTVQAVGYSEVRGPTKGHG